MKKLLATTAVAMIAMSGAASAQSVLERVLGQIDNATNLAQVNGTFANIAENIGTPVSSTVYQDGADVLTQAEYDAFVANRTFTTSYTVGNGSLVAGENNDFFYNEATNEVLTEDQYIALSTGDRALYNAITGTQVVTVAADGDVRLFSTPALRDSAISTNNNAIATLLATAETISVGTVEGIDGSITNIIDGITDVTQEAVAGSVTAIEYNMPTFDFGDMATTALGAVNTGDITLGVNSSVDNAKTSTTEALSSIMTQLGGSADTGAIVLNIASNMTGVNGSISNTMEEVNGSIGNLSTTALGAVNTGTIVSGVNAAVQGITGVTAGQSGL